MALFHTGYETAELHRTRLRAVLPSLACDASIPMLGTGLCGCHSAPARCKRCRACQVAIMGAAPSIGRSEAENSSQMRR